MPALRKLGLQIYGDQFLSALQLGGQHGGGATLMGMPLDRLGVDYLLLGGRGPAERRTDAAGGASAVPAFAAALCVCAPRHDIMVRLDPWCFTAAHIARIGANLDRLAPGRLQLLLDFANAAYADETPTPTALIAYAGEVIDLVRAHWQGRVEHEGPRIRSHGRIVGPRPDGPGPAIWVELPAAAGCDAAALSGRIDGTVLSDPGMTPAPALPRRLQRPAILRLTTASATAILAAMRLSSGKSVVAGTAEAVAARFCAEAEAAACDDLVVGLPGLCPDESRWFADDLAPRLRGTAPQAGG